MRRSSLLGIALIVLGISGLGYHSTSYRSLPKQQLYEPAPLPRHAKRVHPAVDSVALPAIGASVLLGGVAILFIDRGK